MAGTTGRPQGATDKKKRRWRTVAEIAEARGDSVLAVTSQAMAMARGDADGRLRGVDILSKIVNGEPIESIQEQPPYRMDIVLRAATTLAPFELPRLSSVEVKDDNSEDKRREREKIEELHRQALEGAKAKDI